MYEIILQKKAQKDLKHLMQNKVLLKNANELIEIIKTNPYQTQPRYEKLTGDLEGAYSRRINIQHRLVYEVDEDAKCVKVLSLWSHYEF
jgi:Txe/YoeB family toxin of toxin-antitoxin system